MTNKRKFRRDPKPGTLLRFKLRENRYAHFFCQSSALLWLYDFLADYPTKETSYFSMDKWLIPFFIMYKYPDLIDVGKLDIDLDSIAFPQFYRRNPPPVPGKPIDPALIGTVCEPGVYLMRVEWEQDPNYPNTRGSSLTVVSEEETRGRYYEIRLLADEVAAWLLEQEPKLSLVHIPPEHRDLKAVDEQPMGKAAEPEPILIEIEFPWQNEGLVLRRDEIEDVLMGELEESDRGTVIGSGAMSGPDTKPDEGSFDVAIEVEPRRLKGALRIIRKVLKQFNAPPGTIIRETRSSDIDPIIHPLEPPKK